MLEETRLKSPYKGYVIEGSAESAGPDDLLFATATVLLEKPEVSVLRVYHFQDRLLVYDNADLAAWFGLEEYLNRVYNQPQMRVRFPEGIQRDPRIKWNR